MHELGLASGVLAVALDAAQGGQVRRVRVRIGALQQIVANSLQFSFQVLAEDSPAAGSVLEVRPVRALVRCRACGARSGLKASIFRCSRCGSDAVAIVSGDEVIVDAVELEDGWRYRPRPAPAPATLDHLAAHAWYDREPARER